MSVEQLIMRRSAGRIEQQGTLAYLRNKTSEIERLQNTLANHHAGHRVLSPSGYDIVRGRIKLLQAQVQKMREVCL